MRNRLSCPIFSTSGLLFMMVLTLARGNNTSLDLSGELVATDFSAPDTGVVAVSSVIVNLKHL